MQVRLPRPIFWRTRRAINPTLIAGKDYEYAWLGISGTAMTGEVAVAMDLPAGTRGPPILSVTQGGQPMRPAYAQAKKP